MIIRGNDSTYRMTIENNKPYLYQKDKNMGAIISMSFSKDRVTLELVEGMRHLIVAIQKPVYEM